MANVYDAGLEGIAQQEINWASDTIKACLVESGCTFTRTHATLAAVLGVGGGEFDADSGYARQTLTTCTVALDGSVVEFHSDNPVFSSIDSADTAIAMVIYKHVAGGDANCIPLFYCDFADEAFTDNNLKTLTVVCPAAGWGNLT